MPHFVLGTLPTAESPFQRPTARCTRCPCDCVPPGPAVIWPTMAGSRVWAAHISAWNRWAGKGSCSGSPTAAPAPPAQRRWAASFTWCDRVAVAAPLRLPRPQEPSARRDPCTLQVYIVRSLGDSSSRSKRSSCLNAQSLGVI